MTLIRSAHTFLGGLRSSEFRSLVSQLGVGGLANGDPELIEARAVEYRKRLEGVWEAPKEQLLGVLHEFAAGIDLKDSDQRQLCEFLSSQLPSDADEVRRIRGLVERLWDVAYKADPSSSGWEADAVARLLPKDLWREQYLSLVESFGDTAEVGLAESVGALYSHLARRSALFAISGQLGMDQSPEPGTLAADVALEVRRSDSSGG